MPGRITHIWRYPIKAHGRESLTSVELKTGQTMPWDRAWAVTNQKSKADGSSWVPCANFSRGSILPALMAINITLDESTEKVTLSHPELPDLTVHPERDKGALLNWVAPIMADTPYESKDILRVPQRGMTDTDYPSISLNSLVSHRAVEQKIGHSLDPRRWRGNIWMDGLDLWEEFDWVGRELTIGEATLKVAEPIVRCSATMANPDTGKRDADTLATLKTWGHQNFGIYAQVTNGGAISVGDEIRVG